MTNENEEARRILIQNMESLKANPLVTVDDCLYKAFDTAIKALEQTERIAKLVKELHLEDVSQKDFDNMFYLQSVKEVKEEMWRMYCFAEDVSYTLDTAESEDKE